MPKRWQYLIKAHVPAAKPPNDWKEQITIDKWEPEYPHTRRSLPLALSAAILAGACFLVPPASHTGTNSWKEQITPDKWAPTYPNQFKVLKPARQIDPPFLCPPTVETITADKWTGEGPDIRFPKVGLSAAIQAGSFFKGMPWDAASALEAITIDKWIGEVPDFRFDKPALSRAIQSGSIFYQYIPGEIITIDKWMGETPDFRFERPGLSRAIQSGFLFKGMPWDAASAKETITSDKWLGRFPDLFLRVRGLPASIQCGSIFYQWVSGEIVTIDKWIGRSPDYLGKSAFGRYRQTEPTFLWTPPYMPPVILPSEESIRQRIINAMDTRFRGIITPETFNSVWQQIINALDLRFKAIIGGGYKLNLGNHVFPWKATPLQSSELPALVYRDRTDQRMEGCGVYEVTMPIEIEISANTPEEIRECIAELEKAIYSDKTWGGLALHTKLDTTEMKVDQKLDYYSASKIVMTVFYLTVIGDPYTKGY